MISELNDEELLEVTKVLVDDGLREIVCDRCGEVFFVEMARSRNRHYCDSCLDEMLELEKQKRKRKGWCDVEKVNDLELLDFVYRVEKKLCPIGENLEKDWNNALERVKFENTMKNRQVWVYGTKKMLEHYSTLMD